MDDSFYFNILYSGEQSLYRLQIKAPQKYFAPMQLPFNNEQKGFNWLCFRIE
jgi:hypothetical protein